MTVVLEVKDLVKEFHQGNLKQIVLDHISFSVEKSSFASIVGPSGCGKSTLLNIIAGIEPCSAGEVKTYGKQNGAKIGYVFQGPRLLPWSDVIGNVLFVHEDFDPDMKAKVENYLEMVGLLDSKSKYPHQLSGGMQQRVGIARALSIEPDMLLMDEPFSHLDAITAKELRRELLELWQRTGITILFVTHDLVEAILLSDTIFFMSKNPGRITNVVPVTLPRPRRTDDLQFFGFQTKIFKDFESLQP